MNMVAPVFQLFLRLRRHLANTKKVDERLNRAHAELRLYRRCLEETGDSVIITDHRGLILKVNQAFEDANDYSQAEVRGIFLGDLIAPHHRSSFNQEVWPQLAARGKWRGEFDCRKKSGTQYTAEFSFSSVKDEHQKIIAHIAISRDTTMRKRYQNKLIQLINHDPLTGMFNRRRFEQELHRELAKARRQELHFAVLWLDLDQFKEVNESLGHKAGDSLLVALSAALPDLLREEDVAARMGGDEFAILMSNTDKKQAELAAKRIIDGIRNLKLRVDGTDIRVTTSVGIALYPNHGINVQDLLARADIALYQSKDLGRNKLKTYQPGDGEQHKSNARVEWTRQLREAIEKDRFVLHGQPIVDVNTNQITHYELLVRMLDDQNNLVMPNAFIPIAERSGIIRDLDHWVCANAIKLLAQCTAAGHMQPLSINLSASAFCDDSIVKLIQSRLQALKIDPSLLIIEITESSAIADIHNAKQFLHTLKKFGCQIALDDFGVGFSSFSHLKHLDTDYIKLDGSFIRDLLKDDADRCIVEATIKIARQLGKRTVAEWVENQETLDLLRSLGVTFAQGYHIGKPAIFPPLRKAALPRIAASK